MIATPASTPASVAAKTATSTIPIVFSVGSDPVALGLVSSLNRPGGNATGGCLLTADVASKQVQLVRELAPQTERYFSLVNPTSPLTKPFVNELEGGAAAIGVRAEVLSASTDAELAATFASLPRGPGNVLILAPDTFFYSRRTQIVALAVRYSIPTIFANREFVEAGGLASYGSDFTEILRLAGTYSGRILRGEKPANLPVVQSSKFELVLNLKAAKAIGLVIPEKLVTLADDLIE